MEEEEEEEEGAELRPGNESLMKNGRRDATRNVVFFISIDGNDLNVFHLFCFAVTVLDSVEASVRFSFICGAFGQWETSLIDRIPPSPIGCLRFCGPNHYRILPSFNEFYRVLLDFTVFYLVLPSFNEFHWVLLGFTVFHHVLLSFTGFYRF